MPPIAPPPGDLAALRAEIDRIDVAAVRAVCEEFFSPARQTIVTLGPTA